MTASIELSNVSLSTPGGRPLFEGLDLRIDDEHVALVGRNGVGKSTLLAVLAGELEPRLGRVRLRGAAHYVPQPSERGLALSQGEQQRLALREAHDARADILLLDEPSEHLDEPAVSELRDWLRRFTGCLIVVSHDRRMLADFRHFFIVSESGCRYFGGTLGELDEELERDQRAHEQRYVGNLQRLTREHEHTALVARRRGRKSRSGRTRELDRCTARIRLNRKRSEAQVSHGRLAKLREARLGELRDWTRSTRRALNVSLSLELTAPTLAASASSVVRFERVEADRLFGPLDMDLGRQRIAVVGPNGAGKTTLLDVLLGKRRPSAGSAWRDAERIGSIEQGGANWALPESLLDVLGRRGVVRDAAAEILVAHKFPLALAERALASLSPGERARAALICLFSGSPTLELLVLDEPTFSLDLVAQRALVRALSAWPGGLVVSSHDREFLRAIGTDTVIELGGVR